MNLTEAQKLVILAALRLIQDDQLAFSQRTERIMYLEQGSASARELLCNESLMDELWELINENEVYIKSETQP